MCNPDVHKVTQMAFPISLNFEFIIFKQELAVLNLEFTDGCLLSHRAEINRNLFLTFSMKLNPD